MKLLKWTEIIYELTNIKIKITNKIFWINFQEHLVTKTTKLLLNIMKT